MAIDHRLILSPSGPSAAAASDPFELWQLSPLSRQGFAALGAPDGDLSQAQLRYWAAYALLAPSSHNTVPQRFLFPSTSNAIEICVDREVVLSASDPTGRQASISLGCGIAHLIHAARYYGFEAAVELYDGASALVLPRRAGEVRYARVARVRFQRGGPSAADSVLQAMLDRRSVRADYNASVALPGELTRTLTQLMASQYPELELYLLSDAPTVAFLGQLQGAADTAALTREDFAVELGDWLVENDSVSPLGMRGREYGMQDETTRAVRARFLGGRLSPEDISGLARGGSIALRSSSAVGIIVTPLDDLRHRILAGRAFEDLVLALYPHGFVTAVHAAITELEGPNLALRERLGVKGRPSMIFRMGQPLAPRDAQRPHSARPSVSDVTLTESLLGLQS